MKTGSKLGLVGLITVLGGLSLFTEAKVNRAVQREKEARAVTRCETYQGFSDALQPKRTFSFDSTNRYQRRGNPARFIVKGIPEYASSLNGIDTTRYCFSYIPDNGNSDSTGTLIGLPIPQKD